MYVFQVHFFSRYTLIYGFRTLPTRAHSLNRHQRRPFRPQTLASHWQRKSSPVPIVGWPKFELWITSNKSWMADWSALKLLVLVLPTETWTDLGFKFSSPSIYTPMVNYILPML